MSPRNDNQNQSDAPETEVLIPHGERTAPPTTAPPLPTVEPPAPVTPPVNVAANLSAERPPIPPPVPPEEFYEREGRRWPVILMYIILAFLVAMAIVLTGRWVYQKVTDNKPTPPAGNNQGQAPAPPGPTQPTAPSPGGQPAAGGELPNNGPGDVVALFVGTAIVVGGLHYLYSLRQQN